MLPPELNARLLQMADAQKRSVGEVLADAVLECWIRFATRQRLPPPW